MSDFLFSLFRQSVMEHVAFLEWPVDVLEFTDPLSNQWRAWSWTPTSTMFLPRREGRTAHHNTVTLAAPTCRISSAAPLNAMPTLFFSPIPRVGRVEFLLASPWMTNPRLLEPFLFYKAGTCTNRVGWRDPLFLPHRRNLSIEDLFYVYQKKM